jgi:uncharacterized protein (TIGR02996 family)
LATSEETALLRAILDDPDDDGVRLVYADWLDDRGDATRAEFIRTQIELARLHPGHPGWAELAARVWRLQGEHSKRWEAELPHPKRWRWGRWHRGFVDEVHGAPSGDDADAILAAVPLRRLTLDDRVAYGSVAESPLLVRIRELAILVHDHSEMHGGEFEDPHLAEVLRWPVVERLTHFELKGHNLSPEGMKALAEASLPKLRSLVLREPRSCPDGRPVWEQLLTAEWLENLEELSVERHPLPTDLVGPLCEKLSPGSIRLLSLVDVGMTDAGATVLARSGLLNRALHLRLDDNEIGPTGARVLNDARSAGADLELNGNTVVDGGLAVLAGSSLLRHITRLAVAGPPPADGQGPAAPRPRRWPPGTIDDPALDRRAVVALAASPNAYRLWSLALTGRGIDSEAARAILTSAQLGSLGYLSLDDTDVTTLPACRHATLTHLYVTRSRLHGGGLAEFCGGSHLPGLETLALERNRLGHEAAAALAGAAGFDALTELRLCDNPLGDEGATALAGSILPKLAELTLRDCGIGDRGATALAASPLLSRLKCLWLESDGNPISEQAYRALKESASKHGCRIDSWAAP